MSALPSGTVTFLFTDVEESTKLWQAVPHQMKAALARHDDLLRRAIEAKGGTVFKTVGDAFCAAFQTALDALGAAVALQRSVLDETWSLPRPIRVRAAVHTGEADERDGDYFGPALNRVARLLSIGHGGQTLVSLVSAELARDMLPEGVTLRDMGARRLKDLTRPESVFQADAAGLPSEFPPLKSLDLHPHNFPTQPTPLIGREKELEELQALLRAPGVPIITLVGMGGMGKTRLALQAAAEAVDDFEDGAFFVDLAPVDDPGLVISAIAHTLAVRQTGSRPLAELVSDYLSGKRMVLMLDNFEQVMEAAVSVSHLVGRCPNVKFLVTSREALRIRGERVFAVAPLSLPSRPAAVALEMLRQYEAVRLFIERAVAVNQSFTVTNENAPAVAEICVRLDGIPLAIELAAVRIKLLPPEAILARLASRLRLLTGGPRDLPGRQKTLRMTIDWSYELLEPEIQVLFAVLSVFSGGFALDAAETVCGGVAEPAFDVLDGIESLVDKSLLLQCEPASAEPRFRMLETIREYGQEKLAAMGEGEAVHGAHARFFLRLAEDAGPKLHTVEIRKALDALEREHDNLREAYRWLAVARQGESLLRLAAHMAQFWLVRGYLSEGRDRLRNALAAAAGASDTTTAEALRAAGVLSRYQSDYHEALALQSRSLSLAEGAKDGRAALLALEAMGWTLYRMDALEDSRGVLERAERIGEELGDEGLSAMVDLALGTLDWRTGTHDRALQRLSRSLSVFRKNGDLRLASQALCNVGLLMKQRGDPVGAMTAYEEARLIKETIGDVSSLPVVYNNLGELQLRQNAWSDALANFDRLLRVATDISDPRMSGFAHEGIARCRMGLGEVDVALVHARQAVRLAERAESRSQLAVGLLLVARLEEATGRLEAARAAIARARKIVAAADGPHGDATDIVVQQEMEAAARTLQSWGTSRST